nr:MAG TPA: chromosome segregation ATPase [Caudoviricetes sp.]
MDINKNLLNFNNGFETETAVKLEEQNKKLVVSLRSTEQELVQIEQEINEKTSKLIEETEKKITSKQDELKKINLSIQQRVKESAQVKKAEQYYRDVITEHPSDVLRIAQAEKERNSTREKIRKQMQSENTKELEMLRQELEELEKTKQEILTQSSQEIKKLQSLRDTKSKSVTALKEQLEQSKKALRRLQAEKRVQSSNRTTPGPKENTGTAPVTKKASVVKATPPSNMRGKRGDDFLGALGERIVVQKEDKQEGQKKKISPRSPLLPPERVTEKSKPLYPDEISPETIRPGQTIFVPMKLVTRGPKGESIHDMVYSGISEEELVKKYGFGADEARSVAARYSSEAYKKYLPSLKGVPTVSHMAGIPVGASRGKYQGPEAAGRKGTALHTVGEMAIGGWKVNDILTGIELSSKGMASRLSKEQLWDLAGVRDLEEALGGDAKAVKEHLDSFAKMVKALVSSNKEPLVEQTFGAITNVGGKLIPWGGTFDLLSEATLTDFKSNQKMSNKMGWQLNLLSFLINLAHLAGYDIPNVESLQIAHQPAPMRPGDKPTPKTYAIKSIPLEKMEEFVPLMLTQFIETQEGRKGHYNARPFASVGPLYDFSNQYKKGVTFNGFTLNALQKMFKAGQLTAQGVRKQIWEGIKSRNPEGEIKLGEPFESYEEYENLAKRLFKGTAGDTINSQGWYDPDFVKAILWEDDSKRTPQNIEERLYRDRIRGAFERARQEEYDRDLGGNQSPRKEWEPLSERLKGTAPELTEEEDLDAYFEREQNKKLLTMPFRVGNIPQIGHLLSRFWAASDVYEGIFSPLLKQLNEERAEKGQVPLLLEDVLTESQAKEYELSKDLKKRFEQAQKDEGDQFSPIKEFAKIAKNSKDPLRKEENFDRVISWWGRLLKNYKQYFETTPEEAEAFLKSLPEEERAAYRTQSPSEELEAIFNKYALGGRKADVALDSELMRKTIAEGATYATATSFKAKKEREEENPSTKKEDLTEKLFVLQRALAAGFKGVTSPNWEYGGTIEKTAGKATGWKYGGKNFPRGDFENVVNRELDEIVEQLARLRGTQEPAETKPVKPSLEPHDYLSEVTDFINLTPEDKEKREGWIESGGWSTLRRREAPPDHETKAKDYAATPEVVYEPPKEVAKEIADAFKEGAESTEKRIGEETAEKIEEVKSTTANIGLPYSKQALSGAKTVTTSMGPVPVQLFGRKDVDLRDYIEKQITVDEEGRLLGASFQKRRPRQYVDYGEYGDLLGWKEVFGEKTREEAEADLESRFAKRRTKESGDLYSQDKKEIQNILDQVFGSKTSKNPLFDEVAGIHSDTTEIKETLDEVAKDLETRASRPGGSGGATGYGSGSYRFDSSFGGVFGSGRDKKPDKDKKGEEEDLKRYKANLEQVTSLMKKVEVIQKELNTTPSLLKGGREAREEILVEHEGTIARLNEENSLMIIQGRLSKEQVVQLEAEAQARRKINSLKVQGTKGGAQSIFDVIRGNVKNTITRMFDYTGVYRVLNQITASFQKVITLTKELDTAIFNLRVVSGANAEEARGLIDDYNKLAKQLGATTVEIANAANEWLN